MILADTSVWVNHFRVGDNALEHLLETGRVVVHPLHLIEREALFGRGIGYVDAHLLAAVRLTSDARLWTRDKRLGAAATEQGLAFIPT